VNQKIRKNSKNEIVETETEVRIGDKNYRSVLKRNFIDIQTTEVTVSTENVSSTLRIVVDHLTSKVKKVDDLIFDHSARSTMIKDEMSPQFLYISEKDENGREKSRTMLSNGQVIFHQLLTYSHRNQV
jgi:hypothetical protein